MAENFVGDNSAASPLEVSPQQISHSIINLGTDSQGNPVPDNFTNGEAVVYSLAPGATAIGGLTPGTTYFVIIVNGTSNQFQLAATPGGGPITLNTSNATGEQYFTGHTLQILAYVADSSINAAQALTVSATSNQMIGATVHAGSVAVTGGVVGLAFSGAGVSLRTSSAPRSRPTSTATAAAPPASQRTPSP